MKDECCRNDSDVKNTEYICTNDGDVKIQNIYVQW